MNLQTHLITDDSLLFLGTLHTIQINQSNNNKNFYCFKDNSLILSIKVNAKKSLYLDRVLKIETKNYIDSILPHWIAKTDLQPTSYSIRKMKKWGSCNKKKHLQFNSYLVCLPPALIDYIVCHELAHIRHFDHSKKFHQLLATFLPNVKKMEKDLKMFVR